MRFKLPSFPRFPGVTKFLHGVLADDGGDPSAKRTGFFVFIFLIVVCTFAAVFGKLAVPGMIWNGLVDLCKWIGTAILGERLPEALSAFRGGKGPDDKPKPEDNKANVIP